jgi:ribosome recycling factor
MAEEGRVKVRTVRRDAMDALKRAEKDGKISEDERNRMEKEVQAATDKTIKDIADHLAKKNSRRCKPPLVPNARGRL